jgi:hypothetical protein
MFRLTEPKEIVGDITAYATDSSPTAFFKRMHPDERMLDSSPTKVNSFHLWKLSY